MKKFSYLLMALSTSFIPAFSYADTTNSVKNATPTVHQVPSYFVQKIGDLTVTALLDGQIGLPRSDLLRISTSKANRLFAEDFVPVDEKNQIITSFNAYLVQTPTQNILIDTGTSSCFGESLGKVRYNLKLAGVSPEAIDTVLITHAHPDHLCGITANGKKVYPNAKIYLSKTDVDYWTSASEETRASDFFKPIFKMARDALKPYQESGQLVAFTEQSFHVPNVSLVNTNGHTKGHYSYLIKANNGESFLGLGDVVHYEAVQFLNPNAVYKPDTNSDDAAKVRKQVLEQAYQNKWWIGGAHISFPGLGHVGKNTQGYRWIPAQYLQ